MSVEARGVNLAGVEPAADLSAGDLSALETLPEKVMWNHFQTHVHGYRCSVFASLHVYCQT